MEKIHKLTGPGGGGMQPAGKLHSGRAGRRPNRPEGGFSGRSPLAPAKPGRPAAPAWSCTKPSLDKSPAAPVQWQQKLLLRAGG